MKLIKASYEIITPISGDNILKDIELASRTCYKSEGNIKEGSDVELCKKLIHRGHNAMLEFGDSVIFKVNWLTYLIILLHFPKYFNLSFSKGRALISGSIRAYRDYGKRYFIFKFFIHAIVNRYPNYDTLFNDIKYQKFVSTLVPFDKNKLNTRKEKEIHLIQIVKFTVDRGVSHELVRHRIASFAQESTRFCNYGKDEHITFIIPSWFNEDDRKRMSYEADMLDTIPLDSPLANWYNAMYNAERWYNSCIEQGWSPQQARSVLPNSLKTEINISANIVEWRHIFKLRTANSAHPDMQEIMRPLLDDFKNRIPILFDDIEY